MRTLRVAQRLGMGLAVSLVGMGMAAADEFQLEEGFTRLDNGQDLAGWRGKLEGWSVVDGAIQLDANRAKGSIFSETLHGRNCTIRLQFRAAKRADSGVYIYGKQLQVRDYPKAGPARYARFAKPAGQWNDLEWDITDGVAVVRLNGNVIEGAWRIGTSPRGIGLQKERGDFAFRYIRFQKK